jgi:hypothetical protein
LDFGKSPCFLTLPLINKAGITCNRKKVKYNDLSAQAWPVKANINPIKSIEYDRYEKKSIFARSKYSCFEVKMAL